MTRIAELASRVKHAEFNSSVVRRLLSAYFRDGHAYRLPFGPLRGRKLHYERTVNYHVILGLWEAKSYSFLTRLFRDTGICGKGCVVADVGANLGYFSIWAAREVAPGGKVFAFEPSPSVVPILKKNLALNPDASIEHVEMAASDKAGELEFFIGDHHHESSLDPKWASNGKMTARSVKVPGTTLDTFFDESTGRPTPDLIKVDIEGGGVFALKGMSKLIQRKRAVIWMESHNPPEDRAISEFVLKHDYGAYRIADGREVTNLHAGHPDPEGIWGTLLIFPKELRARLRPVLS